MTCLIDSVFKNDLGSAKLALAQGADPNERDHDGRSALLQATIDGKIDFVSLLLDYDVDVNVLDDLGFSALHYAAQNHFPDAARLLIAHGAKVDTEDFHGNTPLARAVFNSQGKGDMISVLLDAGADRNHPNKHGQSPLNLAKLIANYDVLQYFE